MSRTQVEVNGETLIWVPKYYGQRLKEIDIVDLDKYLGYLESRDDRELRNDTVRAKRDIAIYLKRPEVARELERELEKRSI